MLEHHHTAVGVIDLEIFGTAAQLIAFGRPDGGLHILFTDATSGVTDYTTCPVAPAENRLPVAVEAGEKNPR